MITLLGSRIVPRLDTNDDGMEEIEVAQVFLCWGVLWGSMSCFEEHWFGYLIAIATTLTGLWILWVSDRKRLLAEAWVYWRDVVSEEWDG